MRDDKDWYKPVPSDKRRHGARKRSYLASAGESVGSSSERNLYKGWSGELKPLSRGIVGENIDHEETLLTETNRDIKSLIIALENKNEDET